MEMWIIWMIVAILLVVVEVMTQMLLAICFAAGALVAMISSLLGVDLVWQIVIMAIVSIIVYFTALPMFRRFHNNKTSHSARTGMDALLGRRCVVTKEILPGKTGRVRIDGDNWQAIAPEVMEMIPVGTEVEVISYDSIILTVKLP